MADIEVPMDFDNVMKSLAVLVIFTAFGFAFCTLPDKDVDVETMDISKDGIKALKSLKKNLDKKMEKVTKDCEKFNKLDEKLKKLDASASP